jgi:hypothetical protein
MQTRQAYIGNNEYQFVNIPSTGTLHQMTSDELMQFYNEARSHPRLVAKELLDNKPGSVAAARDLAHYAANLATAKSLPEDSDGRQKYLAICGRIRQDLPDYALPCLGETGD